MNFFIFVLIISIVYSAKCPNDCNKNGLCGPLGECECYYGYEGYDCSLRKCSYGYYDTDSETELVCSGNGLCNQDTGLCECFPGYTGAVCNVVECKNRCSGHGMCVLSHQTYFETDSFYPQLKKLVDKDYKTYGVGVCVCDREYYGDDCSLRKCQLGYNKVKDSDDGDVNQIIIDITEGKGTTYIEYTDPFDRKWYSSKLVFDATNGLKQYGYYEFTDKKYPSDLDTTPNPSEQLKWCYVLSDFFYTLPPGTIDLKNTTSLILNEHQQLTSGCNIENDGIYVQQPTTSPTKITITLTFGPNQSGRQGKVRFLTENDKNNIESGEVDMSIFETSGNSLSNAVNYKYKGIYPQICGGNGKCNTNRDKGVCDCFDDYTGYSCEVKPRIED